MCKITLILLPFLFQLACKQKILNHLIVTYKKFDNQKDLVLNIFFPPNFIKNDGQKRSTFVFSGGGWVGGSPNQFSFRQSSCF